MVVPTEKVPRTDGFGNCVECGRLICPNETDIAKAQLVLSNAGWSGISVKGYYVLISPSDDMLLVLAEAIKFASQPISELEPVNERKHCSVCGEEQFDTTSGLVCKNGHGGVPSIED